MNKIDEELVNKVALAWIMGGGDEDGFLFLWTEIANRIEELAKEKPK